MLESDDLGLDGVLGRQDERCAPDKVSAIVVKPGVLQVAKRALKTQCPVKLSHVVVRRTSAQRNLLAVDEVGLAAAVLKEAAKVRTDVNSARSQLLDQATRDRLVDYLLVLSELQEQPLVVKPCSEVAAPVLNILAGKRDLNCQIRVNDLLSCHQ